MSDVEQTSAPVEQASAPVEVAEAPQPNTESLPEPSNRQGRRDAIYERLEDFIQSSQESEQLKQDEILNGEGGHTGIDYNRVIADLPEDAKKILANLRSDYTRKTQEISAQRKALEGERNAWEAQRKAMVENRQFHEQVERAANQEVEFNPYDESTYKAHIEQEVAKRMKEMMRPIQEEHVLQTRRGQLAQFKEAHPDLTEFKVPIYKALQANAHMSLEQAYWMVKGQHMAAESDRSQAELTRYRKAAQEAGLKIGGTSRAKAGGVPKHVKEQGSWAIAQFFMNNKS